MSQKLKDPVLLQPLQEKFIRLYGNESISFSEVARRIQWYRSGVPDSHKVSRELGLVLSNGLFQITKLETEYPIALELSRALHVDPVDCGI
jgi:hypothetical protein